MASNISVWDNILLDDWKSKIIKSIKEHRKEFDEFGNVESLRFLMETISEYEGLEWLPKVVTPEYAMGELQRIRRDIGS